MSLILASACNVDIEVFPFFLELQLVGVIRIRGADRLFAAPTSRLTQNTDWAVSCWIWVIQIDLLVGGAISRVGLFNSPWLTSSVKAIYGPNLGFRAETKYQEKSLPVEVFLRFASGLPPVTQGIVDGWLY